MSFRHSGKEVRVVLDDDGPGFNPDEAYGPDRMNGLTSMRRRAELVGGTVNVRSLQGEGTRLSTTIPLQTDGPKADERKPYQLPFGGIGLVVLPCPPDKMTPQQGPSTNSRRCTF